MPKKIIACLSIVEDKKNNKILMIKHHRGINKGYFNFPGGKTDKNENILDANIRETIEETGITPISPKKVGFIDFPRKGFAVTIFYTDQFEGELLPDHEEVNIIWQDKDNIPYEKMREADKIWAPKVLSGEEVNLRINYDDNFNLINIENLNED